MTEAELEVFRLKLQILASENVMREFARKLAEVDHQFPDWLANLQTYALNKAEAQTISGVSPEFSDLATAEYLDALKNLFKRLERNL